jgi:hypothetical protein
VADALLITTGGGGGDGAQAPSTAGPRSGVDRGTGLAFSLGIAAIRRRRAGPGHFRRGAVSIGDPLYGANGDIDFPHGPGAQPVQPRCRREAE